MSKKEFLSKLKVKLTKYEDKGVEKVIQYYTEIIDDKLELGMTEREAVDSLGEMDDIVESLMIDLVERTDKAPERTEPIYLKEPPIEQQPIRAKPQKAVKEKAYSKSATYKGDVSYDIFHDFDLVGKSGYKLNKALNRRFDCGYKFVIYSIFYYLFAISKVFSAVVMSIASVGVLGGCVAAGVMTGDSIGKVLLMCGAGVFASAIVMIVTIVGIKIIGLIQSVLHSIMRKVIDKRVMEVKYEAKL